VAHDKHVTSFIFTLTLSFLVNQTFHSSACMSHEYCISRCRLRDRQAGHANAVLRTNSRSSRDRQKKWRNTASERRGRRDDRGLSPHNYTSTITFVSLSDGGDVINNNCTYQVWTDNFDWQLCSLTGIKKRRFEKNHVVMRWVFKSFFK